MDTSFHEISMNRIEPEPVALRKLQVPALKLLNQVRPCSRMTGLFYSVGINVEIAPVASESGGNLWSFLDVQFPGALDIRNIGLSDTSFFCEYLLAHTNRFPFLSHNADDFLLNPTAAAARLQGDLQT